MKSSTHFLAITFASFGLLSAACGGVDVDDASLGESAAALDAPALELNDCTSFLDLTAAESDRQIVWDFSVANAANRCMKVRVGQTVTWVGNLRSHPLAASGGDTPSAIEAVASGASAPVTFTAPGTYGYVCTRHRSMKGAIYVVE